MNPHHQLDLVVGSLLCQSCYRSSVKNRSQAKVFIPHMLQCALLHPLGLCVMWPSSRPAPSSQQREEEAKWDGLGRVHLVVHTQARPCSAVAAGAGTCSSPWKMHLSCGGEDALTRHTHAVRRLRRHTAASFCLHHQMYVRSHKTHTTLTYLLDYNHLLPISSIKCEVRTKCKLHWKK